MLVMLCICTVLKHRSGDKRTAEILVKHGANVNKLNSFNESPLFFAADYSDNTDLVQFLVEK